MQTYLMPTLSVNSERPSPRRYRVHCLHFAFCILNYEQHEWARQDSNLGPTDYEPAALTAELRAPSRARRVRARSCSSNSKWTLECSKLTEPTCQLNRPRP